MSVTDAQVMQHPIAIECICICIVQYISSYTNGLFLGYPITNSVGPLFENKEM